MCSLWKAQKLKQNLVLDLSKVVLGVPPCIFRSSTCTTVFFVLKNPSSNIKWLLIEFVLKREIEMLIRPSGITGEIHMLAIMFVRKEKWNRHQ